MTPDLSDLNAFLAVARARGFREASRTAGISASALSERVRRLESALGIRLLHRTTRSVTPTEAGARLLDRLGPALDVLASGCDAGIRYDEWLEGDMIALPIGPHSISLRCKLHYGGE